jgi:hypothetical protein
MVSGGINPNSLTLHGKKKTESLVNMYYKGVNERIFALQRVIKKIL